MLVSIYVKFVMSILNWQVKSSLNFASFFIVMTHNSPVNFKLIHFLIWKKDPIKVSIFRLSNVLWWKFTNSSCHFWKHKSVFLQILHQYSVPSNITTLYLFSSNILYFGQKQPIKEQIFEIFKCSRENLPNSSCHFRNH